MHSRWVLGFVFLCCVVGCRPGKVYIGPPRDRYDHNRSIPSSSPAGVTLPLSSAKADPNVAESDRADLLDFLGSGPMAHAGMEPTEMSGSLPGEVETVYPLILEVLGTEGLLLKDKRQLKSWAREQDKRLCTSTRVNIGPDAGASYPPFQSEETLAIYGGDFWFVLYRLPSQEAFTRLVVVPIPPKDKDLDGKAPSRPTSTSPKRANDCAR